MVIVGFNLPSTFTGEGKVNKNLKDGAACIIMDDKISYACAEERITRNKHCGGYINSLANGLEFLNLSYSDIELIVTSSCCEPAFTPNLSNESLFPINSLFEGSTKWVSMPSHHLSHAYSSFFPSGFSNAIIMVSDAGGNVLANQYDGEWWSHPREQSSYFIGQGNSIEKIGMDFEEPFSAGFGEVYRAFTHYLGWNSYTYSANTMALAAYGNSRKYSDCHLFDFIDGEIISLVENSPNDPISMVIEWAKKFNISLPSPRQMGKAIISEEHTNLANFVQTELENALVKKISHLIKITGIKNICLAGGVALNCVANGKILHETEANQLFIQPASDDTGQALGNALFGYYNYTDRNLNKSEFFPYLGRSYTISDEKLIEYVYSITDDYKVITPQNITQVSAELLCANKILGWYSGRSEYGPRALGNRSILANPHSTKLEEKVRAIKEREFFRPFAPSILREYVPFFFSPDISSPFMLLTATAKPITKKLIPSIVHVDGTSRLQTVTQAQNAPFYRLIQTFYEISGIPALLNTSFNGRGEPIVDKPQDACLTAIKMGLDGLVISNKLVIKKDIDVEQVSFKPEGILQFNCFVSTPDEIEAQISDKYGNQREKRYYFSLFEKYAKLLQSGRKITTIRTRGRKIDYPATFNMQISVASSETRKTIRTLGEVVIARIEIKEFCTLTEYDAIKDGFTTLQELREGLLEAYENIDEHDLVTIYTIRLL